MTTPWARYVRDITARAPQREIAAVSGISASLISRWMSGRPARPRAEQVIQFARGYKRPPGEALMAAGYLNSDEYEGPSQWKSVASLSNDELVAEIERFYMAAAAPISELVSRFVGRPVEIRGGLSSHPGRRKGDPGRIEELSDADLYGATTEMMGQRAALMDELGRRLLHRDDDSK